MKAAKVLPWLLITGLLMPGCIGEDLAILGR